MAKTHRPKPKPPSQRPGAYEKDSEAARRELTRWLDPVRGGKHIRTLRRLIDQLRGETAHGNQKLFLDDVFVAYLLAFFNPSIRSLRTLEDFSQTQQGQRHLSIPKLCRSTLSDFNKLADPERLRPILDHLRREVLKPTGGRPPNSLAGLHRQILAVDGTFLHAAADVVWAIKRRGEKSGARLDFHVDVETWLPEVVVAGAKGQSEAENAKSTIVAGAIHLYDRGIFSHDLVAAHADQDADFVMRMREAGSRCPKFTVTESRELTEDARRAGVLSDRCGHLTGSKHCEAPKLPLREVVIVSADDPQKRVRLLTNLLDLDASVIGLLYRNRWQIELFFRWLKCYANFDHLISHNRDGVLLNFYVAIVGVLLLYLHSGHRPSKYLFALMGQVASGAATLEEIMPILRERERQNALERNRVARKRAEKSKP
jgi:hypothetical protein